MIHATSDRVFRRPVSLRSDIGSPGSGSFVAFGEARHRAYASAVGPSPKAPAVAGGKPTS